jgi:transposase-like protein
MIDDQATDELSLMLVTRMSEDDARRVLMTCRWSKTGGRPVCTRCGHDEVYIIGDRRTFRCKKCRTDISITSGTIFAGAKISAKDLLLTACIFIGGAKGISSLQISRYLGCQYATSFVLAHKMREAMQRPQLELGGTVQVDGCSIGGHRIPSNESGATGKRRYQRNLKNRRVVVVAREPFGNTRAFVGKKESEPVTAIAGIVAPGSVIHVDGGNAWNSLSNSHEMARVYITAMPIPRTVSIRTGLNRISHSCAKCTTGSTIRFLPSIWKHTQTSLHGGRTTGT